MDIHVERVEVLETGHGLKQEYDHSSSVHGLDGPRHEIGRERFKVLQDAHAVRLTENAMRVFVVAVPEITSIACIDCLGL